MASLIDSLLKLGGDVIKAVRAAWRLNLRDLTKRRTNGVLVPGSVWRLIKRANDARASGQWHLAAKLYREALGKAPTLFHIWIQLGHALKEADCLSDAVSAYETAARFGITAEPFTHAGATYRRMGRLDLAAQCYLQALTREPQKLSAFCELVTCLRPTEDVPTLRAAIATADPSLDYILKTAISQFEIAQYYFDVTDLMAHFCHSRLPTGIQRLQIEIFLGAIQSAKHPSPQPCFYTEGSQNWHALHLDSFRALVELSVASDNKDDHAWVDAVRRIFVAMLCSKPIIFPPKSTLINLGTSWSNPTYFSAIRREKSISDLCYVALLFDLIPQKHPEWFPASSASDFLKGLDDIHQSADKVIAISQSSAGDLIEYFSKQIQRARQPDVRVVPIDGDFRSRMGDAQENDSEILRRLGIDHDQFVLMVSTIEPRKNHLGALKTWNYLIKRKAARPPILVCVGGRGWMNDHVYNFLKKNRSVSNFVRFAHGVSDADLRILYQNCSFTIYPSHYEGWGLPISESLAYHKVPVISDNSSMPEAGGNFAVYFDSKDQMSMNSAIEKMIHDLEFRDLMNRNVQTYQPRSWTDISDQLLQSAVLSFA